MPDFSFENQTTLPVLGEKIQPPKACPKKIGPYEIQSLFSKGGMSLLYLGNLGKNEKPLIIKVLPPNLAKEKELVKRFLKEAEIISLSNHPNIVRLYGQGTSEEGLYIAMEFIQGISLRQFLTNKSFSLKKALEIILQVSYALSHLHNHKIIHRDLKPENILISESGEVKVIDFGIAQLKNEELSHLKKNVLIGTPAYMSPEQRENPENVTFQTDIYSLGVITYELVLGRFSNGKIDLCLLPKDLQKIIERTICEDLKRRYQNVVDFITDVAEYIKKINDRHLKEEENLEEILSTLDQANEMLLQNIEPSLGIEIAFTQKKGEIYTGIYLDHFQLPEKGELIICAESLKTGIKMINSLSLLRGIIRGSVYHFYANQIKNDHLCTFISNLNQILLKEKRDFMFAFSVLFLSREKNELIFSSYGHNLLFCIQKETKTLSSISSPNEYLGKIDSSPTQTKSLWNEKDRLILISMELHNMFKKQNLTPLKKSISDNIKFPLRVMNNKILKDLESIQIESDRDEFGQPKIKGLKKSAFIMSIERKK